MLLVLLSVLGYGSAQRPTVILADGPVLGIPMATWMGRNISAFRRIPFAAPPLGPLRFQDPQPVQPWSTPIDGGLMGPACPQLLPGIPNLDSLEEDCLYLNVYTPQLPTPSTPVGLPVLVYIHGGGFGTLAGSIYGPRYLLDYNIVFVTINYRLGALGFLSTQDNVVPGNMGLKDQVAALRWINANIAAFGGNPNDVTIGGTSAGAASVQYHFLSRMSRGLFRRGICMSGSALMPSAFTKAPLYKLNFLAAQVGCTAETSARIIACLRRVQPAQILAAQNMLADFYGTPPMAFGPVVERSGPSAFLNRYPYQVLRIGDVQPGTILFSVVTQEGLFPAAEFLANLTGISALNTNFLENAPSLLDYVFTVTHAEMNSTSRAIREFYFGNEPITAATNQSIIRMTGDRSITNDVETSARLQSFAQAAPIYFYQFGYRGQYSLVSQLLSMTNKNWGVGHGDDTMYIFNATYIQPSENTPSDRAMIRVMSSLWANFAINGYKNYKRKRKYQVLRPSALFVRDEWLERYPSLGSKVVWPPLNRKAAASGPLNYVYISSPTSFIPNSTLQFGNPLFWNNLPINEPMSGRPARAFL